MENKKILYRTESCYGSGIRDVQEIMKYEIFELMNTDILETLKRTIFKNDEFAKTWIEHVIEWCQGNDEHDYSEEANQNDFCKWLIKYLNFKTNKNIQYALWLAEKEAVMDKEIYGAYLESEEDVDAYEIGDILLSDIGYDGRLYGYENYPEPIKMQ